MANETVVRLCATVEKFAKLCVLQISADISIKQLAVEMSEKRAKMVAPSGENWSCSTRLVT